MKKEKNMTENIADKEMSECKLCPRNCKKNRKNKEKEDKVIKKENNSHFDMKI